MPDDKRVPWQTQPELWEKLKPLAAQMRHNPTAAEQKLWQQLRRKSFGVKFRRQHAIDRFITDFYCAEARLIVEIDGAIHNYTQQEDAIRQAFLESLGLQVLRFSNGDVLQNMDAVLERIGEVVQQRLKH
jgi:very-short-patch-repair endonuclease